MSIEDLKRALQGLDEPTFCEGKVQLAERLAIMLPDGDLAAPDDHEVAALLSCVVFEDMMGDGGGYGDDDASTLAPWIVDTVGPENWVFRTTAAATFLRACDFADDGFIGNGAVGSHLYKLAALELKRR
jgi:hypothetical protein